ncbi:kinase-like protein [Auricularia subglabra TFB-10046 SS5]|nr:kinase-like protein [Auricularia subglabra TFB-10046 SS5]
MSGAYSIGMTDAVGDNVLPDPVGAALHPGLASAAIMEAWEENFMAEQELAMRQIEMAKSQRAQSYSTFARDLAPSNPRPGARSGCSVSASARLERDSETAAETAVSMLKGENLRVETFDGKQLCIRVMSNNPSSEGATSVIYKGRLQAPDRSYTMALKVLRAPLTLPRQDLLRRELETVAQLAHKEGCTRILPVIGLARTGDQTILVSQFMVNGNLLSYIKEVPSADKRRLVVQVAEGLAFLHDSAGLVHGNLKCENVLVTYQGNALLGDCGLGAVANDRMKDPSRIDCNAIRFTAPEMPIDPENGKAQTRSKTQASDVYAFGMLVLQTFTETEPWPGLSAMQIVRAVSSGGIHAPPSAACGLTDAWWRVFCMCWQYDPSARPAISQILGYLQAQSFMIGG